MSLWQKIKQPPWRTIVPGCALLLILARSFWLWSPGLDVRDGRHDRKQDAIWISHGWLGDDGWFIRNDKTNELGRYRKQEVVRALATKLHRAGSLPILHDSPHRQHAQMFQRFVS